RCCSSAVPLMTWRGARASANIQRLLVNFRPNTMAERSTNVVRKARRRRDPEGTRELILEAARGVLAQDGKEGLSVAQVAQIAGVNRGTAYQHFQTREQLLEATAALVSEKLYRAVFGDPARPRTG